MKKLILLFFISSLFASAKSWDDIKSNAPIISNSLPKAKNIGNKKNLLISTNIWIVVKTKNVEVYSHNRDFSILINDFAEKFLTSVSSNLNLKIPKNFHLKIYLFDTNNELKKYLDDSFAATDIQRWCINQSALAYRFNERKKLRKKLLQDDLPFLITFALLNAVDKNNTIPFSLKNGLAISFEQSVSNRLKKFSSDLANDQDIWVCYKILFDSAYEPDDDPDFIDVMDAEAAAWAMFIKAKLLEDQISELIYNLAEKRDLKKSFAKAFEVSLFDTMPRIEERVRQWLKEKFPANNHNIYYISQKNRILILVAFAGIIIVFFLTILYKWLKDLIK